ncbi:helix-turn-helix domain-containing protein [Mycobacterium vicinigordonae]|uniref:Helix-turn-helix transcriptional regulator n=1 Tax=Mycobacterium vicinigordonae TaxID=1719132 RepID=A0A7D6E260_9MYCO|nr:helix-turn-helix domain-containing protein [Mycobacterium vicinigordonae]QLL09170.1 helix-turn-helix transcriptional regulator [Mycobacterium vicinigordonae]
MHPTGPRLYRPRPPLADHVEYFGIWQHHTATHDSRALPRGAATVIIDLGGQANTGLFAADGRTPLPAPAAFLIGAGVRSYVTRIGPAQSTMTIHFRPAGALAFADYAASDFEDRCVGLSELWGSAADRLHERLVLAGSASARVALLEKFLLGRLRERRTPELAAVLRDAEVHPSMRVSGACQSMGLSPKRFNALFRAEVGMSPKAYLRVRRLQAALRALNTPTRGAAIAADLGYFDQAHFVREFQEFAAITPTQYTRRRSPMIGHITLG